MNMQGLAGGFSALCGRLHSLLAPDQLLTPSRGASSREVITLKSASRKLGSDAVVRCTSLALSILTRTNLAHVLAGACLNDGAAHMARFSHQGLSR